MSSAKPMASPPSDRAREWSASSWVPLVYEEVVRTPDTYGVVILGDAHEDPLLVSHGSIREEMWRFHRSPRIAAHGVLHFRYIVTILEHEAELLAVIVRDQLSRTAGHEIAWRDFPPLPAGTLPAAGPETRAAAR